MAAALEQVTKAHADLERLGDEEGAVWALRLIGNIRAWLGDSADAARYYTEALRRAEHVSPRLADDVRVWLLWACWWGATPAEEVLRVCDEVEAATTSIRLRALVDLVRGATIGSMGRVEEGRRQLVDGRKLLYDLGGTVWWAGPSMMDAEYEVFAGDYQRGYDAVVEGAAALAASAETGYLATIVGYQSQMSLLLGRDDEALRLANEADAMGQADDFEPHARARITRAYVFARRGDIAAADAQVAEAAELAESKDYIIIHLDLAFARAEVARLAGRPDEARAALEHALAVAEAKGHALAAEQARTAMAELEGAA
jgi:tetratricopeptide (TPR) repeat protein